MFLKGLWQLWQVACGLPQVAACLPACLPCVSPAVRLPFSGQAQMSSEHDKRPGCTRSDIKVMALFRKQNAVRVSGFRVSCFGSSVLGLFMRFGQQSTDSQLQLISKLANDIGADPSYQRQSASRPANSDVIVWKINFCFWQLPRVVGQNNGPTID